MIDPQKAASENFATSVLMRLVTLHHQIGAIEVFYPPVAPLVQERCALNASETGILDSAQRLRANLRLPFWDAVMLSYVEAESAGAANDLFQAVLHHNPSIRGRRRVLRDELCRDGLRSIAESTGPKEMVAVLSRVHLKDGTTKHIPMLDFHVAVSSTAESVAKRVAISLGLSGFLLNSGKSYHFYGDRLIDEGELVALLARASLFGPIVDRAWIAHQLIEGACALRISPRPQYGGPPYIVARVD